MATLAWFISRRVCLSLSPQAATPWARLPHGRVPRCGPAGRRPDHLEVALASGRATGLDAAGDFEHTRVHGRFSYRLSIVVLQHNHRLKDVYFSFWTKCNGFTTTIEKRRPHYDYPPGHQRLRSHRPKRSSRPVCRPLPRTVAVVAINDLGDAAVNAHLFQYDSVHGRFPGEVEHDAESLRVMGDRIAVSAIRNPAELPWKSLGVDIVLECTGLFTSRDKAAAHPPSMLHHDQNLSDVYHPDLYRARSATQSMIPTDRRRRGGRPGPAGTRRQAYRPGGAGAGDQRVAGRSHRAGGPGYQQTRSTACCARPARALRCSAQHPAAGVGGFQSRPALVDLRRQPPRSAAGWSRRWPGTTTSGASPTACWTAPWRWPPPATTRLSGTCADRAPATPAGAGRPRRGSVAARPCPRASRHGFPGAYARSRGTRRHRTHRY